MTSMIDKTQVLGLLGVGVATLYRWIEKHPKIKVPDPNSHIGHPFPKPQKDDAGRSVWNEREVREWWDANKTLVNRHPSQAPTVKVPLERWIKIMLELKAGNLDVSDDEFETRQRTLNSIKDYNGTIDEVWVNFETAEDAVFFSLRYI